MDQGFRFRLFSARAEAVELCLFAEDGTENRLGLRRGADGIWQGEVAAAEVGDRYGYRVHGPFAPERGDWFNPAKLLVDPYARALTGEPLADSAIFGFRPGDGSQYHRDGADSAAFVPKALLIDETFDDQGVARPRIPWSETVIYEAHVRGLTRRHPELPEAIRGTYLGLCHPAMLQHFQRLGVTTLELLPICQFGSEKHLLCQGRRNYWGYSPLAFFAPHAAYASAPGGQVTEVKTMVRELHRAGLEVLVDMVFNHTVEGGHLGPTLSLKGIDNRSYYRMAHENPGRYVDFTGCGNTLDIRQAATRELVLGALRYWATEIGVDGFRLDLAPVLGRDPEGFSPDAPFFQAIAADPLLAKLKWIAEPWDLGPEGYQLGGFPEFFVEWNDRFRNTVRRYWRGDASPDLAVDLAKRLAGSPDVFGGRTPNASLNYVCAHDGFTLTDLNSYNHKHNLDNGEDNRDGTDANYSNNWGVEGPTEHPGILAARRRAIANQLATWVLGAGIPMLSHGDEFGRSQQGNNNAYCQDNASTWVDWELIDSGRWETTRWLLQMRRHWSVLRAGERWRSHGETGSGPVAAFFGESGALSSLQAWAGGLAQAAFGLWLDPADPREEGILALFNGGAEPVNLKFPAILSERRLTLLLYSAWPKTPRSSTLGLSNWTLEPRTTVVFTVGPLLKFEAGSGWP